MQYSVFLRNVKISNNKLDYCLKNQVKTKCCANNLFLRAYYFMLHSYIKYGKYLTKITNLVGYISYKNFYRNMRYDN
jgi:hypothetical protein